MKKLLALLLALVMIFALAACGQNEPAPTTPTDAAPADNTPAGTVSKDPEPVQSSDKEVATTIWTDQQSLEPALIAAAEAFTTEHPNYTVNIEAFPGSERPQKLALAKESSELPGLFLTAFFTSADEVHQGTIVPVTGIVNSYYSDIGAAAMDQVTIGSDYYMVPIFTSPQGMLYNADIFKAAGLEEYVTDDPNAIATWTVQDLDAVILPALKEYFAGTSDYPLVMYSVNEQNDSYLHNLLKMYGGEIFVDGRCVAGEDPNTVKALEKIVEWVNNGYTNADATTRLWTDCNADFRNQKCAISAGQYQSYLNHIAAFEDGGAEAFDVRVATVPVELPDGTNTAAIHTYVYGFAMMNVDEDQQQLAKEFLAWLSENRDYVVGMINGVPTMPDVLGSLSDTNPLYTAYQGVEDLTFDFTGGAPGWVATRATFYPEIQSAFAGQKSAQDALNDYMDNANEIITGYRENSLVLGG